MLVRSSRPSHASTRPGRSSRSPSFGADSTFSASTTFGDSGNGRPRATSELSFATVSLEGGFVDLGADQVVASPTSYTIQPNRTMQVAGPTQVADTLPSTLAASSAKPSPSAVASSPPRQFPTRHSSLLAASSDHSPQRLPISRATSPLPGSSSPTRASHRALSPRPAGRLTCMTPLSSSRRQTDVEMWRESCRQFLQVLRDGPAGAVPVAHAEGSSSGRRAAALRRDVAESSELSGLALPRARLPAQSSPRGTSSSSAPTSLSTSRGARTSLDGLGAPQGSYTSYGSRWEGSHSASAATVRGRRSLSVRRTPQPPVAVGGRAVNCGDEAEDERVWSKWRRWVRERREAVRRER
ncbi:hypothetical protein DMC30DRAFT_129476 [Rhodotorula diobovata]|uniref:Uncharacterized protein n=1 Tax=Rhodotorula diobovata TaxID=5288 RepID=A0A5C5G2K0_9BASI|nr:hypothetical protein DMC30DRAFT_129476 [Rhodotorula diobovata]